MKKIISLVLCFILACACIPLSIFADEPSATATINGQNINTVTENGRILAPIKPLADALGIMASYDEMSKIIVLRDNTKAIEIHMTIDSPKAKLQNREIFLDVVPKLIDNQVYIPLRFITEVFEVDVEWNGDTVGADTSDVIIKDEPAEPAKPLSPLHIEFADVSTDSPNARAIDALTELGVLAGYEDKTFKPENTITRAEFATVICRFINKATEAQVMKGVTNFQDVNSEHWANGYINYAFQNGIISGIGDELFAPEENVTQIQAIKMILGAGGYVADYPQGYADLATRVSIWLSDEDSNIPLTRELAAKYLYNALTVTVNDNDPIKGKRFIDVLVGPIEMDSALKEEVIRQLAKDELNKEMLPQNLTDNIYLYQLAYVTSIEQNYIDSAFSKKISSLEGIQYMPNLTYLNVEYQAIKDLSPLYESINRWAYEFIPRYTESEVIVLLYGNFDIDNVNPLQNRFIINSYPCHSGFNLPMDIDKYNTYKKDVDNVELKNISNSAKYELFDKWWASISIAGYNGYIGDSLSATFQVIQRAQQIVNDEINNSMSDREKLRIIHDYMINNCIYDEEAYQLSEIVRKSSRPLTKKEGEYLDESNAWSPVGVIMDNKAVCGGYALTFQLFCTLMDIPCAYICGNSIASAGEDGKHAWNAVIIDGEILYVDVTWDDPIPDGNLRYDYFLVSEKQISQDHFADENQTEYNSAWKNAVK